MFMHLVHFYSYFVLLHLKQYDAVSYSFILNIFLCLFSVVAGIHEVSPSHFKATSLYVGSVLYFSKAVYGYAVLLI